MNKIIALLTAANVLFLTQVAFAQKTFDDVRQEMADNLTSVKTAISENDRPAALNSFNKAKNIWQNKVKPMIVEGQAANQQFQEYFDRINEVEGNLSKLAQSLKDQKDKEAESAVNAIIWGISHHPRGFDVPKAKYTIWDWVFGLGIGIGFCAFIIPFGLYLRRSYYRRYKKDAI